MTTTSADEVVGRVMTWGPNRETVTLPTGRKMVLRKTVPMTLLAAEALEDYGENAAAVLTVRAAGEQIPPEALPFALAVQTTIIKAMVVRPEIVPEIEVPDDVDVDGDGIPSVASINDLVDEEIDVIVERALRGPQHVARFRGDDDGGDSRARGEGVESKPKRRSRATSGKS